ncbi:hypothetical protein HGRIS_007832 [Hohenbuehelia grisea]|uniref:Uncharacterized protein n=1 Tax=Hohenbuehelia grisea TaxID=104357 RepID=A0ABR3J619_9AGAR
MQSITRQLARSRPSLLVRKTAAVSRPMQFLPSRSIVITKYTKDHERVVFDDATGTGIVSLTDHAQAALGDVVFVELPAVGTEVSKGGGYLDFCTSEMS